ncbi:HAMP domain-containing histidine kinase [Actinoallomurus spadix]|uniref:Sensor-like histidine kinase SenX3 n=1 Tax=Actinoallomurus spadix TaxID=79912 RepID=A0ABP3G9S6_9ACTN|nr:HAMP domain-containing sensor histidine kinase [Actinoallomurus spadix]MCO5990523.1 HAMP domain-containing histidine kinase [Actinoallomurus spadix]
MSDDLCVVVIGGGSAAAVGLVGLAVMRALRGRSLRLALFVLAVASVLAMVTGTVVAAQEMFISPEDFGVVLTVCIASGIVTSAMALLLARALVADSRTLRRAVRALGHGAAPGADGSLSTAEMGELSRELSLTSARLARARERERSLERSRRELVAWVSHDLRTPLAGLRAMVEALEDGVAPEPSRYHTQMRLAVDRLSGMVDDLFMLSRIHAGALALSLEWVTLADLVDQAVAGTNPLARAQGVRLGAEVGDPVVVRADVRELSRALTNLVVNAIRHTPSAGSVLVEAGRRSQHAVLAVSDACGGIPPGDLDRVFDVAWRGTAARTPEPDSGAGLGLAIVRGIVEAHSGAVEVRNTDHGCRFEVRLPLSTAPYGA